MSVPKTLEHKASIPARLTNVVRKEGVRGLVRYVLNRRKYIFWMNKSYLLSYPLSVDMPIPQTEMELKVERVTLEDQDVIRELVEMYQFPTRVESLEKRMRQGKLCYVGRVNGKIVGYVWVHLQGPVQEYERTIIRLKKDEVYNHDAYVIPQLRGKKLYPALKAQAGRLIAQEFRKTKMISYVLFTNTASYNASRKLGVQRIGYFGYYKLFGRRFHYLIRHRPIPM